MGTYDIINLMENRIVRTSSGTYITWSNLPLVNCLRTLFKNPFSLILLGGTSDVSMMIQITRHTKI